MKRKFREANHLEEERREQNWIAQGAHCLLFAFASVLAQGTNEIYSTLLKEQYHLNGLYFVAFRVLEFVVMATEQLDTLHVPCTVSSARKI